MQLQTPQRECIFAEAATIRHSRRPSHKNVKICTVSLSKEKVGSWFHLNSCVHSALLISWIKVPLTEMWDIPGRAAGMCAVQRNGMFAQMPQQSWALKQLDWRSWSRVCQAQFKTWATCPSSWRAWSSLRTKEGPSVSICSLRSEMKTVLVVTCVSSVWRLATFFFSVRYAVSQRLLWAIGSASS